MTVYFISGLGADERTFQKLVLPGSWEIIHLRWLPVDKNETLKSYAEKFAREIDTSKPFNLVGLSFGGVLATELLQFIKPDKTIIISSISNKNELPVSFKLLGVLKINKLVPAFFLNKMYPLTNWRFGMKTKEGKKLLGQIIHDTSPAFLKWAINEILNWKKDKRDDGIYHIHGDTDRIFPLNKVKADLVIKNGGHFMVYSQAEEISKILIERLMS
ncbi:MAG TPA: alpha/beta hydrolase [Bacteroidia bacterium]|nr:alpha/beta hydrolase [Bacteroidia bacterium]